MMPAIPRLLLPSYALRTGRFSCTHHVLSRRLVSSSTETKVGFVGLGNMGLPMCLNILSSKFATPTVYAYDMNDTAMEKAERGGARLAKSFEDMREENCNVIFTMLPGCEALDTVMTALLQGVNENGSFPCVYVDCSTVSPTTSRRWHDRVAAQNDGHSAFVDAPVSGGVKGAQDGTLTFMVGSRESSAVLATARPFLECMGKRIIPCGGPGTGSATKLCNNLALATQMIGICEAMNLGEALGVDPVVLANVMNTSTAKCWSSEINNPHPVVGMSKTTLDETEVLGPPSSRDYQGGFGTKLMLKDLGLAVAAGQEVSVALPMGAMSKELYRLAQLSGLGEKDFGVMLQFLRGK